MKYKLLKDMPDIKAGKIGVVIPKNGGVEDTVVFESDYGLGTSFYTTNFVKVKTNWFAPLLLTTVDGVEIFKNDEIWTIDKGGFTTYWRATENSETYFSDCKIFSTKEAVQKYLATPKFNVGDFIIINGYLQIMKLDKVYWRETDWIGESTDCAQKLFLQYVRKATNEEVLKYYEKLGWVKDAKFIVDNDERIVGVITKVVFSKTGKVMVEVGPFGYYLERCTLVKEPNYPKTWEELVNKFPVGDTKIDKRMFATPGQYESVLAFAKLSQLLAKMNAGWEADWNDRSQWKYFVERDPEGKLCKQQTLRNWAPLVFKTEAARDFSFKYHKELWNKYYQL